MIKKGKLPKKLGSTEIIECVCGTRYSVTYHGEAIDSESYENTCNNCKETLFTEHRDCYSVKEIVPGLTTGSAP
ncbi:hypothetical protein AGMMS49944_11290 [Spirochaetia bacterium]|nr:hypothetical protein AGMMS49944_11290 [Spirochaetia bacterium]